MEDGEVQSGGQETVQTPLEPKTAYEEAIDNLREKGIPVLDFDRSQLRLKDKRSEGLFKKRIASLLGGINLDPTQMLYRSIDGNKLPAVDQGGTDFPEFDTIMANAWPEWTYQAASIPQRVITELKIKTKRAEKPAYSVSTPLTYSYTKGLSGLPAILVLDGHLLSRDHDLHFKLLPSNEERLRALKAVIRVHDTNFGSKTKWRKQTVPGTE